MNSINTVSGKVFEGEISDLKLCPLDQTKGQRLLRKTLASYFLPEYWPLIGSSTFYFCGSQNCPIIYFNNEDKQYFSFEDVKRSVMHKMPINTPNRPACYCLNVLESVIVDELLVKKCCDSLKDIQEYTKANTGKDCTITNPSGRCCGKKIQEIIAWARDQRDEIHVPTFEEAESCCAEINSNTIHLELIDNH